MKTRTPAVSPTPIVITPRGPWILLGSVTLALVLSNPVGQLSHIMRTQAL